ncbi:MAG: signal peptidase I [Verrucomicrobia bacterium]|jgi:signal peptidase I|nr:signal peptidase I [Verrucomicrobiota bacterium]
MTNKTKTTGPPCSRPVAAGWPVWLRIALIGRRPRRTLLRVAVLLVVCLVVFNFILLPIRVTGASMLPTYRDGGINLVNRCAYLRHEPRRGDVVSIRLAGYSIMYMKRIVGLPGETVAFVGGRVVINGKSLDEPYVKFPCDWERAPVKLAPDQYFVVGDNRSMPIQNHELGEPHRNRIVGKVLL